MPVSFSTAVAALRLQLFHLVEQLQLPSWRDYQTILLQAGRDSVQATQSVVYAFGVTCKPFCILLYIVVHGIARLLYQHIFLQGICNHGLTQAKQLSIRIYQYESRLTKQQLATQGAVLVGGLFLIYVIKMCQRRRYFKRLNVWYDREKRRVRKSYRRGVQRIATVSVWLATMTPHFLFGAWVVGVKLALPRLVTYLACRTSVIPLLRTLYPIFCTITILQEAQEQAEQDKKVEEKENKSGSPSKDRSRTKRHVSNALVTQMSGTTRSPLASSTFAPFPRTSPMMLQIQRRKRRSSLQAPLRRILHEAEPSVEQESRFWWDYWFAFAMIQLLSQFLQQIFLVKSARRILLTQGLQQIELCFYIWVYVMPHFLPRKIGTTVLPDSRPLTLVTSWLRPTMRVLHHQMSNVVTEETWQKWVVSKATTILNAFVFVHLFSQATADFFLHALQHGRSLIVPALTLLFPSFLTKYGVMYVQYVVPMSRNCSTPPIPQQLQYWVLHVMLSSVLSQFANLLWWIPFSTHVILLLWASLTLPRVVQTFYAPLQSELSHFGLLPNCELQPVDQSRTAQFFRWMIEQLPRAQENDDAVETRFSEAGATNDIVPKNATFGSLSEVDEDDEDYNLWRRDESHEEVFEEEDQLNMDGDGSDEELLVDSPPGLSRTNTPSRRVTRSSLANR